MLPKFIDFIDGISNKKT